MDYNDRRQKTMLYSRRNPLSHNAARRAFTLVELLVVIAIIGLLSMVATVVTSSASLKARNEKRKADLIQISKALEMYYAQNGSYPTTGGGWRGNCSFYGGYPNVDPGSWIPGLTSGGYMGQLPVDPHSGKANPSSTYSTCQTAANRNCYLYISDSINYALLAFCTPEGPISPSDPFYETHNVGEYKYSNDPAATPMWY